MKCWKRRSKGYFGRPPLKAERQEGGVRRTSPRGRADRGERPRPLNELMPLLSFPSFSARCCGSHNVPSQISALKNGQSDKAKKREMEPAVPVAGRISGANSDTESEVFCHFMLAGRYEPFLISKFTLPRNKKSAVCAGRLEYRVSQNVCLEGFTSQ